MNEVAGLLNTNNIALLQQGASEGFESLPPQYRDLALQTAHLVGVMAAPASPGAAMPFPALADRLEAVTSMSSQLVDTTTLDIANALGQDPGQRAVMLMPHVAQLRDASHVTAAAVAQMPVAELRANRELVKEKLASWAGTTEAVHEQLKAQFGETHPMTVAALQARTDASTVYGKTMLKMALANLGSTVFNSTIGPMISGVARLFGTGNNVRQNEQPRAD